MAVVTDKIKSVVDFLVKGFEPRETIFDEMAQEVDDYPVEDNLAVAPNYSYRESNEKAIHLYEKFGFKSLGLRKKYYQDNNEDAYIMWSENIFDEKYKKLYDTLRKEVHVE